MQKTFSANQVPRSISWKNTDLFCLMLKFNLSIKNGSSKCWTHRIIILSWKETLDHAKNQHTLILKLLDGDTWIVYISKTKDLWERMVCLCFLFQEIFQTCKILQIQSKHSMVKSSKGKRDVDRDGNREGCKKNCVTKKKRLSN